MPHLLEATASTTVPRLTTVRGSRRCVGGSCQFYRRVIPSQYTVRVSITTGLALQLCRGLMNTESLGPVLTSSPQKRNFIQVEQELATNEKLNEKLRLMGLIE